ncbi:MAG: stage II sporulation protein M [Clostridia bacterium]|nr:stage II sporulation protein M [Clostridia bacterium]
MINQMGESQSGEIQNYLTQFANNLKEGKNIDTVALLKKAIQRNLLVALLMWFAGSTVIGIPIVLGMVAYRGFCLGFSISSAIAVWGTAKGTMFFFTSMLLQNLLFIPCILALAVSGMKLYQSIMKDKRRENLKLAIARHTVFSLIMLILLLVSALIETYLSSNLVKLYVPYM